MALLGDDGLINFALGYTYANCASWDRVAEYARIYEERTGNHPEKMFYSRPGVAYPADADVWLP